MSVDLDRFECIESFKVRCFEFRMEFACLMEGGSMRRPRHRLVDEDEDVVDASELSASGYTAGARFPLCACLKASKYGDGSPGRPCWPHSSPLAANCGSCRMSAPPRGGCGDDGAAMKKRPAAHLVRRIRGSGRAWPLMKGP